MAAPVPTPISAMEPAAQSMHSLSEAAAYLPTAQLAQVRSAVALRVPPWPAVAQEVKAVHALAAVANSVVPSHAVQQAALSAATDMSHTGKPSHDPTQAAVEPDVAS